MKLIIGVGTKARLNKIIEWLIYMVGYTVSFIIISRLFGTFQINDEHVILYSFAPYWYYDGIILLRH